MRLSALFLSVLLSAQMSCIQALAAAVNVNPTANTVQGQVPCNKIGALLLADGLALMSGNTIEVSGHSRGESKSTTQLTGVLCKVAVQGSGASSTVTGYACFTGGPGLPNLNKGSCSERVDLTDGSSVKGPISSITPDQLVCGGRPISMGSVAAIHSASAFKFSMSVANGEAQKMSFDPTCIHAAAVKPEKQSTPSAPSEHRGARIIVSLLCIAGIACAIAIPIAVGCATHHRSHNNNQQQVANLLLYRSLTNRPSPPPVQQSSSNSSSSP